MKKILVFVFGCTMLGVLAGAVQGAGRQGPPQKCLPLRLDVASSYTPASLDRVLFIRELGGLDVRDFRAAGLIRKITTQRFFAVDIEGHQKMMTVTCTGTCTGNGCGVSGCDPNAFGCSACTCPGGFCSLCTCTKTSTGN